MEVFCVCIRNVRYIEADNILYCTFVVMYNFYIVGDVFKNANIAFLSLDGELSNVSQHFDTSYTVPLLVDDINYKSDVTYLPSAANTHSLVQIQVLLTRAVNSCFQSIVGLYRVLLLMTLVRLKNYL